MPKAPSFMDGSAGLPGPEESYRAFSGPSRASCKKARGLRGKDAELLMEKWLKANGLRYHRAGMIGGGGFTRRHDIFSAWDFLVLDESDWQRPKTFFHDRLRVWAVQICTLGSAPARRLKIKAEPWPESWRLTLVHQERVPDERHRGKSRYYWVMEEYETRNGETRLCGKSSVEFDYRAVSKVKVRG